MWKDTTTYTQNKPRIQTSWTYSNKILQISVVKGHIYYPDRWIMHCFALKMDTVPMNISPDAPPETAKDTAVQMVRARLWGMIESLEQINK